MKPRCHYDLAEKLGRFYWRGEDVGGRALDNGALSFFYLPYVMLLHAKATT